MVQEELASACASAEQHVGLAGGGFVIEVINQIVELIVNLMCQIFNRMDQAISINAVKDCAALIDFIPRLKLTKVQLPPSFVLFMK